MPELFLMPSTEIYLDANATTPVLPQACAAALKVMGDVFGNPSSSHASGLKARARMAEVRARARRVLGVSSGELIFVSGATEGIQTAVLSALKSLSGRNDVDCVLYGATEHSAVPQALRHWNAVLGLGLAVVEIPVAINGAHDLNWLRVHAGRAGLVCTMAANNETGVVSDLADIATALEQSPALWLVDGVQALGKLALDLTGLQIDYAAFSGHKLYAPKGIGLLYVREGAPLTPMMAGGGQEGALRSGTENLPAIAALGAVLEALENDSCFQDQTTMRVFNERLATALRSAFSGLVFNAPLATCLPTTLNFSVPGLGSKAIIDVFDAAGLRVSGGSACSAGSASPSHVLLAMGLPAWQTESAVRMSFGPATTVEFIDEACKRILKCGEALRRHGWMPASGERVASVDGITRFTEGGGCCYALVDANTRSCVVIDPFPGVLPQLKQWLGSRKLQVLAALNTQGGGEAALWASALRQAAGVRRRAPDSVDALGWPVGQSHISLGLHRLSRLEIPKQRHSDVVFLMREADNCLSFAFVGKLIAPGGFEATECGEAAFFEGAEALRCLRAAVQPDTLMLPRFDPKDRMACTFQGEAHDQPWLAGWPGALGDVASPVGACAHDRAFLSAAQNCAVEDFSGQPPALHHECDAVSLRRLLQRHPDLVIVDVREPIEQELSGLPDFGAQVRKQSVPMSGFVNALPGWLKPHDDSVLVFVCRSGNRSSKAAAALAKLGHRASHSLVGGLSLLSSHVAFD